jgi:hypothetical protein
MSIAGTSSFDNTDVRQIVAKLTGYVTHAAEDGLGMHEFERGLLNQLLAVGGSLMDQFLEQQHDGDLGDTVERDGKTLFRSQAPVTRPLRSIFGQRVFPVLASIATTEDVNRLSPGLPLPSISGFAFPVPTKIRSSSTS